MTRNDETGKLKCPATLKDVAERAGVDASTVSRFVNDDRRLSIRPEPRDRIAKAIKELNFKRNMVARSLRTARSHSIGMVITSFENPIYAQMARAAEVVAAKSGYSLLISHLDTSDHSDRSAFSRLALEHRVDGIITTTVQDDARTLREISELQVPIVLINRRSDAIRNHVVVDDFAAARAATRHLIDLGHRRIAHLSGDPTRYNAAKRLAGYRAAFEDAGIEIDERLISVADYTQSAGERETTRLICDSGIDFTAIFSVSLLTTAGAMQALHRERVRIPEEVSVIGFHDGYLAELLSPQLTTVRLPVEEMAECAASSLIELIEGKKKSIDSQLDSFQVIERGTTARARPAK